MKRSEIIAANYSKIAEAMVEKYKDVIESDGRIQYAIYIWEDGELEYLYGVQGDNSYLKPRDMEPRELYYVTNIDEPLFNPWDVADQPEPENEAERDAIHKEVIDYCVSRFEDSVSDYLDAIIEGAQYEEKFEY